MRFIPTRIHALMDYAIGLLVLVSPWVFGFAAVTGPWLHVFVGAAILGAAAMTDFEFGIVRMIPMPAHLMLDAGIGLVALVSPWLFGVEAYAGLHIAFGFFELGAVLMTSTRPTGSALAA